MANQSVSVSGYKKKRPVYTDIINAKLPFIPQMLEQKQQEQQAAQTAYWDKDIAYKTRVADESKRQNQRNLDLKNRELQMQRQGLFMKQKEMDFAKKQADQNLGLAGVQLGTGMLLRNTGKNTVGNLSGKVGAQGLAKPSWASNLDIGKTVGAGVTGWGAAKMFGGGKKSKLKRALIGGGAGALSSFLGGSGNTWLNAGASGLAGAAGGLFS